MYYAPALETRMRNCRMIDQLLLGPESSSRARSGPRFSNCFTHLSLQRNTSVLAVGRVPFALHSAIQEVAAVELRPGRLRVRGSMSWPPAFAGTGQP